VDSRPRVEDRLFKHGGFEALFSGLPLDSVGFLQSIPDPFLSRRICSPSAFQSSKSLLEILIIAGLNSGERSNAIHIPNWIALHPAAEVGVVGAIADVVQAGGGVAPVAGE